MRRTVATAAIAVALTAACSSSTATDSEASATTAHGEVTVSIPDRTGDAAVDAVIDGLVSAPTVAFSAEYAVRRNLGPIDAEATVDSAPPSTTTTFVYPDRTVRFESDGNDSRTCDPDCTVGLVEAKVSDLMLGSAFWHASPARLLSVAYARRTGVVETSTETVAAEEVSCLTVPLGAGAETWCTTADGLLARLSTAAVTVTLTAVTRP
jgi:hypothetical protein